MSIPEDADILLSSLAAVWEQRLAQVEGMVSGMGLALDLPLTNCVALGSQWIHFSLNSSICKMGITIPNS